MEKYSVDDAKEELKEINNRLSLLMKEKRALQDFILNENDRIKGIYGNHSKAWELKHDEEFIKEHGRERTIREVALIMNYSERQITRFLNKKDS